MGNVFQKYSGIILVICFIIGISIYYDLPYWLMQKPRSVHVWRQTDCASYALNYFQNDNGFFSPQVHHRHAIDGKTTSEFPIIYYAASKLYKVFGFHDYYIRWINFLILIATLITITITTGFFVKNQILRSFPAILLMLSCVVVYYGTNYLPDVPALCFALIGFHFFVRDYKKQGKWDFYLAIMFSVLGALLKISSAIILGGIISFVLFSKFYPTGRVYLKKHLFASFIGLSLIFIWLIYVKIYNEIGQYFGNLQGTMGIWTIQKNEILYIIQRTFQEWMPALISYKVWVFFIPAMFGILYFWKSIALELRFFLIISLLGIITYFFAFFAVFNVHDYYFINTICFPVILSMAILQILEENLSKKLLRIFFVLAFVLFLLSAEDTKAQFNFRKTDPGWNSIPHPDFYYIEPELRKLGISRHDLIYSPTDPSTNITLYLMNNPGFTRLFGVNPNDAKQRGAKYMVIDQKMLEEDEFSMYKPNIIGSFGELKIIQFYGK